MFYQNHATLIDAGFFLKRKIPEYIFKTIIFIPLGHKTQGHPAKRNGFVCIEVTRARAFLPPLGTIFIKLLRAVLNAINHMELFCPRHDTCINKENYTILCLMSFNPRNWCTLYQWNFHTLHKFWFCKSIVVLRSQEHIFKKKQIN